MTCCWGRRDVAHIRVFRSCRDYGVWKAAVPFIMHAVEECGVSTLVEAFFSLSVISNNNESGLLILINRRKA